MISNLATCGRIAWGCSPQSWGGCHRGARQRGRPRLRSSSQRRQCHSTTWWRMNVFLVIVCLFVSMIIRVCPSKSFTHGFIIVDKKLNLKLVKLDIRGDTDRTSKLEKLSLDCGMQQHCFGKIQDYSKESLIDSKESLIWKRLTCAPPILKMPWWFIPSLHN